MKSHVCVQTELKISVSIIMMLRDWHKQVTSSHTNNNLLNSARNVLLTCKSSNHLKMSTHSGELQAFNAGTTVVDYYSSTIWQTAQSSLRGKTPGAEFVLRLHTLEKPATIVRDLEFYFVLYTQCTSEKSLYSFYLNYSLCHQWFHWVTLLVNVIKMNRGTGAG